jgi:hypothetical protein
MGRGNQDTNPRLGQSAKLLDFLFLLCSYEASYPPSPDAMQFNMRRLHPRGGANRGICVDAEGAMLGPDCVVVRLTARGFRGIERDHAAALQKCVLDTGREPDWLFHQSRRIAEALHNGEIALAQIYGLRIPVAELDDQKLSRIARAGFQRAYNPDEPRIPKGDPHGGEWTTGGASEASAELDADAVSGTGDEGSGDDGDGSGPGVDAPPASGAAGPTSGDGPAPGATPNSPGSIPAADDPPITFKWPDASPPVSAPPQPSSPDAGPSTLGSPDIGIETPGAEAPPAGEQSPAENAAPGTPPPLDEPPPEIPATAPSTTQQINAVLRAVATWLGRTFAILGAAFELDPRVRMVLAAIEAASWLADYLPKITSYLDGPKTLEELQNAAIRPAPPGYEIHHIVEVLRGAGPQSNSQRFPDLIESRENLVRVPYWKHVEIGSWYSKPNKKYGGRSPRDFLRGKGWDEQYRLGIQTLRDFRVLR